MDARFLLGVWSVLIPAVPESVQDDADSRPQRLPGAKGNVMGETCEMIDVSTDGESYRERVCGKPAVAVVEHSTPACAECAKATEAEGVQVTWTSVCPGRRP